MTTSAADTMLCEWVADARRRVHWVLDGLSTEQLMVPELEIVNPLLWEVGHVAWFFDRWVLRHVLQQPPLRADGDDLFDSAAVAHNSRWHLRLPSLAEDFRYLDDVVARVSDAVNDGGRDTESLEYFVKYCVFHADMHCEAFACTRQTLAYPPPRLEPLSCQPPLRSEPPVGDDVLLPGGSFPLGATRDEPFVFDNEKWAHEVEVPPFRIARYPVTQQQFAEFVEAGGYERERYWCAHGWRWRCRAQATQPIYWHCEAPGRWLRRDFDRWLPLEPHRPVMHVNWYEANAWCRWAGRRLPTEAEWEYAACWCADTSGQVIAKRQFPWGQDEPERRHANLDWQRGGPDQVSAFADGDSACGCRQLLGNVWEWTASSFEPYPGFTADGYLHYSQPWFRTHKVLRGGCWATRSRMLRNTWRNYYLPQRRDVWAGFRTCALGDR